MPLRSSGPWKQREADRAPALMPDSFTMSHRQGVNTRCSISTALPSQYRFLGDGARHLQAFARKLKRKPNRLSKDMGGG
jgi:hypothetical protein